MGRNNFGAAELMGLTAREIFEFLPMSIPKVIGGPNKYCSRVLDRVLGVYLEVCSNLCLGACARACSGMCARTREVRKAN